MVDVLDPDGGVAGVWKARSEGFEVGPGWEGGVYAGLVDVHDEEGEAGAAGLAGLPRELAADEVQERCGRYAEGDGEQQRAWGGVGVAHAVGLHAFHAL